MTGTLRLRQGFHVFNGVSAKEVSEATFQDRKQKSKAVLVDTDNISSPSDYESGADTSEETDSDTAVTAKISPDDTVPMPRSSPSQPSSNEREPREAHISRAWYEFDLAVMIALASPVGHWLTGGDHVKNLVLILLLVFYLHQLIEGGLPIFYLGTTSYRQSC